MTLIPPFDDVDLPKLNRLANALSRVEVESLSIGLVGTLGAGKTTFVKTLCQSFGVDTANVTSPTFTLHQVHDVPSRSLTLHHLDTYRIDDLDQWDDLGIDEWHGRPQHWVLVEWADRVRESMPPETLWLTFQLAQDDRRVVFVEGGPPNLLTQWKSNFDADR